MSSVFINKCGFGGKIKNYIFKMYENELILFNIFKMYENEILSNSSIHIDSIYQYLHIKVDEVL